MKNIIFSSLICISFYGYICPEDNNYNPSIPQYLTISSCLDESPSCFAYDLSLTNGRIDSTFKDVVDLMNSVAYMKNKINVRSAKKVNINNEQLNSPRYPADSITYDRAGENYIESKNYLSDKGIDLNFMYTGDAALDYGLKYLGNIDLKMSVDLDKTLQISGLKGYMYVLGDFGDKIQDLAGSAQGVSNIEAESTWKLYQFWLEQSLFDDKLSLLFGLYDLNTEFDVRDASSIFLNPSQAMGPDFSQSGKNGPSIFPTTSLALRVKYNFLNNFTFLSSVFDGVPGDPENPNGTHIIINKNDGLLITNELDYSDQNTTTGEYFKFGAGSWFYTSKFEDLSDINITGNSESGRVNVGFYFFGEKNIIMGENFPANEISFYLRTGIANGDVNQFNSYYGGGVSLKGLLGRKDDILGFAFAFAHSSYKFRQLLSGSDLFPGEIQPFEIVWEATYNFQLNSYISIQPDVQYINNPSLNYLHNNIFLSLIRVKFSY